MKTGIFIFVFLILTTPFTMLLAQSDDHFVDPAAAGFNFSEVVGKIAGYAHDGGHGVAFVDVDNDGDLDIYITNTPGYNSSPVPNYLYINDGNGGFKDEAEKRGVAGASDFGAHACVFADFDRDGDLDLLVANAGGLYAAQNRYYLNDGNGFFSDKTNFTPMNGNEYRTRGIAVGDYNKDGYLDFVITNPLQDTDTIPNSNLSIIRMFRLKKNGKFIKSYGGLYHTGFSQGLTSGDVDGDGDLDLIESKRPNYNREGISNILWLNSGNGNFTNESHLLGNTFYKDPYNYNGATLADIDNDADLDILLVAENKVRLFRNDGEHGFEDITSSSGLEGGWYTGAFGDMNHDGKIDLVLAHDSAGTQLFKNLGDGRFSKLSGTGLVPPAVNDPRGLALGDYDNDGDLDIVVVHKNNIAQLFENKLNNTRFLKFKLSSPLGEQGGIGTKVWLYSAGKNFAASALLGFREVGSSTGYISQNSPEVHFGLKKRKALVDVKIRFLNGSEMKFTNVSPGRTITVNFR